MNGRIAYLLGAGFSHAITPNNKAPMQKELGDELNSIFPEEIKQKYGFNPEKVELFLTAIDLAIKNNNYDLKIYIDRVINRIREIFGLANLCSNQNLRKPEISNVADKISRLLFRANDTIFTINYDCYLENVLLSNEINKWHPKGGYGGISDFPDETENVNKKQNIKIFKLHGSINFALIGELVARDNYSAENVSVEYIINDNFFPGSHMYFDWEGKKELGYIILPSYIKPFKYKGMMRLWMEAAYKLQNIDKLVISGTSLQETDYPLYFLLSLINKNAKLIIIDPNAEEINRRIIKTIPVNRKNIEPINMKIEDLTKKEVDKIYL